MRSRAERPERVLRRRQMPGLRLHHGDHALAEPLVRNARAPPRPRRSGCSWSTRSTSAGYTFAPPRRISSFRRPRMIEVAVRGEQAEVAGVVATVPRAPAPWRRAGASSRASACRRRRTGRSRAVRTVISPISPGGSTRPASSTISISTCGSAFPHQPRRGRRAAVAPRHGRRRLGHAVADLDAAPEALAVEPHHLRRHFGAADAGRDQRGEVGGLHVGMRQQIVEDGGHARRRRRRARSESTRRARAGRCGRSRRRRARRATPPAPRARSG